MIQQVKAFGKSIAVVIWFYSISWMVSGVLQASGLLTNGWVKQHPYLINILTYGFIFAGIVGIDAKGHEFGTFLRKCPLKDWMRFIGRGIGAYSLGSVISQGLIQFFPEYEEIGPQFNSNEPILRFISMVIVAPIVEEYLFRWKVQDFLKEGFGVYIAIIGQALLFGGLHFYRLQKIYASILAGIFGYVREKKGIAATVSMHMTVNFLGWFIGCLLARLF